METAIVVFTRDLRLHDNPALHQACTRARQVVPLFVVDPAIPAPPNRARFLADSLADLRHQLRARQADLVTASFLTRNLGLDWRHGYRHFGQLLADGDVANNAGNWQWVAGTGNNTRPNRVMNPLRQAQRFDRPATMCAATSPSSPPAPRKASTSRTARTGQDRNTPDRSAQFCLFFCPNGPWFVPPPNPPNALMIVNSPGGQMLSLTVHDHGQPVRRTGASGPC
jgi:FAD binding domain of DNA photolyase/DNA photolyase